MARISIGQFLTFEGQTRVSKLKDFIMKTIWLVFVILLTGGLIQNFISTANDYLEYHIITDFRSIHNATLVFPSLTICFQTENKTAIDVNNYLFFCYFDSIECKSSDFKPLTLIKLPNMLATNFKFYECFIFNGDVNLFLNSNQPRRSKEIGPKGGLRFGIYSRDNMLLRYYIGNNFLKPTLDEITEFISPGTYTDLIINRKAEIKLGPPFNECIKEVLDENSHDSLIFKQLVREGFQYRQVNCFETYKQNYIKNLTSVKNTTELEAWTEIKDFDKHKSNQAICPIECDSINYEVLKTEMMIQPMHQYLKTSKQNIEKSLNKTNLTLEEIRKNIASVYVYYKDFNYQQISQIPKTSPYELVSNLGGSTGNVCNK